MTIIIIIIVIVKPLEAGALWRWCCTCFYRSSTPVRSAAASFLTAKSQSRCTSSCPASTRSS